MRVFSDNPDPKVPLALRRKPPPQRPYVERTKGQANLTQSDNKGVAMTSIMSKTAMGIRQNRLPYGMESLLRRKGADLEAAERALNPARDTGQ